MNEGITTVFDAQDISKVEVYRRKYERRDYRPGREYWSQVIVGGYVKFDSKLGRDEADFRFGLNAAFDHFKSQLLREMEGNFSIMPFWDHASGLHKSYGDYREGYWMSVLVRHTAKRPKEIAPESDWADRIPDDMINELLFDAAQVGASAMVTNIANDVEEQLIVRMANGVRDWVTDRAKEETRYEQRLAALKAELDAEREIQMKVMLDELDNESSKFGEARKLWAKISPAGRKLILEAHRVKGDLHYKNGGMGLTTHLSSSLKQRLDELRREGAH
jgi:hypothetical protein